LPEVKKMIKMIKDKIDQVKGKEKKVQNTKAQYQE
jgi:hypothetical protein